MRNEWKDYETNVDLCDINLVLYNCEYEEKDSANGLIHLMIFVNYVKWDQPFI